MIRLSIVFVCFLLIASGHSKPSGRVVGGEVVTIDQVPYLISVRVLGAHRCGGSLLKSNFVLTAAHCIQGVHLEFLKVVAGTSSRTTGGVSLRAEEVIIHEAYNADSYLNDIALIKLNGHLEFSDIVQPVQLASVSQVIRAGTKATITGWGTTSENEHFLPIQISSVDVYVTGFDECVNAYAGTRAVAKGMICTNSPVRGRDSCEGDAGSPLVFGGTQVGIISWGQGCAREEYPRVHVEVSQYRLWIDSKLLK